MKTIEVCPLCNSPEAELLFWNFDRLYGFPGEFGTLKCEDCGLIRLSPRPIESELKNYYPRDYYSYQVTSNVTRVGVIGNLKSWLHNTGRNIFLSSLGYPVMPPTKWQKILQNLAPKFLKNRYGYGNRFPEYVHQGTVLEIGCGSATYLNLLKSYGWHVQGLDLNPQASEAAKTNFGIDVFVGELEDAPFVENSFDYIHMSHVVEHFTNPLRAMKKIRKILKPDGIAYIEVPNVESFESKRSGKFWYGLDAPRHLFMFTPATLDKLFKSSNLKVEKMITQEWNSFPWDTTFELEEKSGEWLPVRPYNPFKYRLKYRVLSVISKLVYLLNPSSGYNISCWISKNKIDEGKQKTPTDS